ncbi:MAG TPA: patatin-like phospholipase family protein, partial [Bryobacteraceae bacterium]|nr:patatin-like phospholipase family protein [Bryobacteraceae bacterium]
MTSADVLAARTVAILTSRSHNAAIYALRGCEDLDRRYAALCKALRKAKLLPADHQAFDPMALYRPLLARLRADAPTAAALEEAIGREFPSAFGKLAAMVLARWDELPAEQRGLAGKAELWIGPATAAWPPDLHAAAHAELVYVARQLYLFAHIWLLRRLARLLDPAALRAVRDFPGMAFSAALDEEMEEIAKRRGDARPVAPGGADAPWACPDVQPAAASGHPVARAEAANLAGLAFSGGGIRSATFNLGVLQFLGEKKLLRKFDYLSTVSGGGYIGSWLHAWVHHADGLGKQPSGLEYVQESLSPVETPDPQDPRALPIRFLRRYSSYLTPRKGLFSADTWTMVNIWLRNTFLNLLVLALWLSAVLLAPYWLAAAADRVGDSALADYWWALLLFPVLLIGLNLSALQHERRLSRFRAWLCRERVVICLIVAPVFAAAWAAGSAVSRHVAEVNALHRKYDQQIHDANARIAELARRSKDPATPERERRQIANEGPALSNNASALYHEVADVEGQFYRRASMEFALAVALLVLVVSVAARLDRTSYTRRWRYRWLQTAVAYGGILWVCAMATGATGALDYLWLKYVTRPLIDPSRTLANLALSAPIFLCHMSIAVFLYMGLLGRRLQDNRREWLARLGGLLGICCAGWLGLCGLAAYGPDIGTFLSQHAVRGLGGLSLTSLTATVSGLISARSAARTSAGLGGLPSKLLAAAAPPVFVFSLLLMLSLALVRTGAGSQPWPAFGFSLACLAVAWYLSRRIDINEFSLHQFYRNRLVRCYLGGARADVRMADAFTGFDELDDLRLTSLAPSAGYSGPYPILNTTLNVTHGEELAWQERKGESFAFTPRFCGFDVARGRATHPRAAGDRISYGGYRPTGDYAYPNPADASPFLTHSGIRVGAAMAISGAAASPNMGENTSSSVAFLMTVLDVRLGWWLGNPRRIDTWQRPGPRTGLSQLLAELTASTNDTRGYVYLSDGGHF